MLSRGEGNSSLTLICDLPLISCWGFSVPLIISVSMNILCKSMKRRMLLNPFHYTTPPQRRLMGCMVLRSFRLCGKGDPANNLEKEALKRLRKNVEKDA